MASLKKILQKKLIKNKKLSTLVRSIALPFALANSLAIIGYQTQHLEVHNNKPQQQLEQTINVMTGNIAAGRGRPVDKWTRDFYPFYKISKKGLRGIEKVIRDNTIHLACIQEIEKTDVRSENQPQEFSQNTQLKNYVFASNITHKFLNKWLLTDGNAVLSTVPLHNSNWVPLEPVKPFTWSTLFDLLVGTEGLLEATIRYKDQPIKVYCNHFSSNEFSPLLPWINSESDREIEARKLAEYIQAPAIVMGDFNSVPLALQNTSFGKEGKKYQDERTWYNFRDTLKKRGLEWSYTIKDMMNPHGNKNIKGTYIGNVPTTDLGKPNNRPEQNERIDYIFIVNDPQSKLQLKLNNTKIDCDRLNSDHCPVIGEIEIVYKN